MNQFLPDKEVYFGEWAPPHEWYSSALRKEIEISPREKMALDFEAVIPQDAVILYAHYTYECYEGNANVIYALDGKLYGVHGSHCSCHGLEGQWDPEEHTVASLRALLVGRDYGYYSIDPVIALRALDAWESFADLKGDA